MVNKIKSAIGGLAMLASVAMADESVTNKPSITGMNYIAPERSYSNGSYILDIAIPSSNTNTYSVVYTTNLTGSVIWKPSVVADNRSLKYSGSGSTNYISVKEPVIGNKRFFALDLSSSAK